MKNNKLILIGALLLSSFYHLHGDNSCVGITSINPETGVSEQGPVRYLGCDCTCDQYRWLINSRCPTCLHKHSGTKTVGNVITIKEWFSGLSAYIEQKKLKSHVANVQQTIRVLN